MRDPKPAHILVKLSGPVSLKSDEIWQGYADFAKMDFRKFLKFKHS